LAAQRWMECFVGWYNGQHRHSAIRYVTPDERHGGLDMQILQRRHRLYQRAREANPERWTGSTRNWAPVGTVVLNPRGVDATAKA
jgi:putative transposase